MDKRVVRMVKRRGLEKILKLPYASANMINEPAREVKINALAEISYRADGRSEMVYVAGFDDKTKRLVFSPDKNEHNLAFTTNMHTILINEIVSYRQLKRI